MNGTCVNRNAITAHQINVEPQEEQQPIPQPIINREENLVIATLSEFIEMKFTNLHNNINVMNNNINQLNNNITLANSGISKLRSAVIELNSK